MFGLDAEMAELVDLPLQCQSAGTGRQAWFRTMCSRGREGSNPSSGIPLAGPVLTGQAGIGGGGSPAGQD